MDGFNRRKEHSKENIRKAAAELFAQFGIAKVSLDDVARRAGVTRATIHNNFKSKENLVADYEITIINNIIKQGNTILNTDKQFKEKLQILFKLVGVIDHKSTLKTDVVEVPYNIELLNDPEIKKIFDSIQDKIISLLLKLIREGKREGSVNPKLSEEAFSVYFKSLMNIVSESQTHHHFRNDPKLMQDLVLLMLYGFKGQSE